MKKLVGFMLCVLLSVPGHGETKFGSKCGLVDSWGDVEEASTTFDLSKSTRRVKSLIKIVKSQLIAAANNLAEESKFKDAIKAAEFLRESSEGQELYIDKAEIKGKKYSVVSYYGGGNHTGYIFPWGKTKPVAEIGDDDIMCID